MLDGECLHDIFAARVLEGPGRVAVSCGDVSVTYAELDARAERIAAALQASGVGPDTLVGLCADRGPGLIAGMLGILKAGGAYMPIDAGYPQERIDLLLEDGGIDLLVADATGRQRVRGTGRRLVDIDDDTVPAQVLAGARVRPAVADHHLAYVIHTSGSTGRPKGVQIEHRHVVRLFTATQGWFGFDEHDVWTMFHSASFDFSVWEIWGALLHGGRLVVVPARIARSPLVLLDLIDTEQVTVLNQTPSAFRLLVAAKGLSPRPVAADLRLIIFGGERLDLELLRSWIDQHGDENPQLVNMYGITETTVHVTYRRIRAHDMGGSASSPIGVPIPDLEVTLHHPDGTLVEDGTAGEIRVAGAGLARGYLGRPDLTGERFVTGPAGRRTYRSGDRGVRRASRDPHGATELLHLGRIDDQLKVRGFRIEPFEVETCLAAHPAVSAAVVDGIDFGAGDVRLVAYIQPIGNGPVENGPVENGPVENSGAAADRLREHVARHLPAHLRPSEYRFITDIPLTAQGKVDRTAIGRRIERNAPAAGQS